MGENAYSGAMSITRALTLTLVTGLVPLVTGCAPAQQGPAATDTVTATSVSTTPAREGTVTSGTLPSETLPPETPACAVNPLTGEQPIPIVFADSAATDGRFFYTPTEDAPNPCLPLSWVTLTGTRGQEGSGPGATAGSMAETVALFGDGTLITDPAPILARRIESVERIDARTIRVNYAFPTDRPAAENVTAPGSATFHWDGAQVTVSDNTLPAELNGTAATLDLSGVR